MLAALPIADRLSSCRWLPRRGEVRLVIVKPVELRRSPGVMRSSYRYRLSRRWQQGSTLAVVGLNPSTADRYRDDATTRRVTGLAKQLGHGGFVLVNLYGFRSTDPAGLLAKQDPVGPGNDAAIRTAAREADQILLAWGAAGERVSGFAERVATVKSLLTGHRCFCQGLTKAGQPRHPLYNTAPVQPYRWTSSVGD